MLDLHLTTGLALLNLQLNRFRLLFAFLFHAILVLDYVRIGAGVIVDSKCDDDVTVTRAEPVQR